MRVFVTVAVAFAALSANAQGTNPGSACFEQMNSEPALSRLLPHVGSLSKSNLATFSMTVSKEKPSEIDRKAIIAWGQARDICIRIYQENYPQGFPEAFIELEAKNQNEVQQLLASLYKKQVTYGEFVELRKKLGEAKMSQIREITAREQARERQEAGEKIQQEIADKQRAQQQEQYQAAVRAQQEAANQAQLNNGINLLLMSRQRPPAPAPLGLSPSINCTSRPSFGSVITNCN